MLFAQTIPIILLMSLVEASVALLAVSDIEGHTSPGEQMFEEE